MQRGNWRHYLNQLGPLLGLVAVFVLFAIIGPPGFSSGRNLETIARQTAIVGMGALGMTLVIISGGIDLSVGSMVALGTVVIASLLNALTFHGASLVAAFLAILACAACGFLSGTLITRLRVVPFIVTLGMMLLVRGAAKGISHEQKVDAPDTWLNGLLASLPDKQQWLLVPSGVWLLIFLAIPVCEGEWPWHAIACHRTPTMRVTSAGLCGAGQDR
ncbi:MAG: ABC transporter permease, partial [Candidatus Omnitrophica bacterium]|nr:ABC transporter permease [Candidatus Omnitrophota bacterium]